tara:strand:+ start:24813 stop:24986 length:174 start_codon:yes stop_codon:yes gene_type:complete
MLSRNLIAEIVEATKTRTIEEYGDRIGEYLWKQNGYSGTPWFFGRGSYVVYEQIENI